MLADEDIGVELSNKLMGKGFSLMTISEMRKKGIHDEEVLELANEMKRVLITRDIGFNYRNWHPSETREGIIIANVKQKSIPDILPKFCQTFTESSDRSTMRNKIIVVRKKGYHAAFVDKEGNLQTHYEEYKDN